MYIVEVFKTVGDVQELFFKVSYDDSSNVISMSGVPPNLIRTWEKFGLPNGPGKVVKPDEGLAFLKAIARDFNGSMSRSDDVREE